MTYAVATPTSSNIGATSVTVTSTGATGGTGPYTYQWYKSTTTGFSPGSTNIIAGATALTLNDTGNLLGADVFYKIVSTDTGNSNTTATSSQLAVLQLTYANASPSQNAFAPAIGSRSPGPGD